nr:hypothetical protein BaRGS_028897 [Batillaria attramentaria]
MFQATPLCELCEVIVEAVDQYVKENKTEAAINATVYKLCNELPASLKDTVEQGPACELCELIVQTVDQYLKDNKSIAAINGTVYKLCNDLPGSIKDTCMAFAPQLVAELAKGLDPKQACTAIKLCTNDTTGPACELCELIVQTVDQYLKDNKSIAAINGTVYKLCNDLPGTIKDTVEQGPACELCELIVQTVDQYLKDNKSIAAINGTVYKLCNDLPGTIKDTCLAFAPQLVAELAKGLDPKQACTAIKLCTNDTTDSGRISVRTPEVKIEVEQGPACELCELIVQTVDQYLKDNKSIAAINGTVYKLCNDLPGTIKDTVEQGPACELCELIVQTVDQYLKDNKSIAAINGTVYKLCNDLPGTIKDTCLAFAPQLVTELAKGLDPKQACTTIKLCTNDTTGPACELCELIVQTVDQYLKDNKSIAAINGTVYKLCNDLPGTIKDTVSG